MNKPEEKTNLITPAGYKRLVDEAVHLAEVERPKIVDEVHQAALQGDRSENAEYIYGKKKLREIDKRLGLLKKRLDAARVIDPSRLSGETIMFGATVTVENEDGSEKIYQIVGEDEADPDHGKISWKSPVGKSLMKKSAGDLVTVQAPNGDRELTVVLIRYL